MRDLFLGDQPYGLFAIIGIVLVIQANWVFRDAEKRGENKWLWGAFALLNTPSNLLIYLLVTRRLGKRHLCPSCGTKILNSHAYCPVCGSQQKDQA
jgi:rubrerythrin